MSSCVEFTAQKRKEKHGLLRHILLTFNLAWTAVEHAAGDEITSCGIVTQTGSIARLTVFGTIPIQLFEAGKLCHNVGQHRADVVVLYALFRFFSWVEGGGGSFIE